MKNTFIKIIFSSIVLISSQTVWAQNAQNGALNVSPTTTEEETEENVVGVFDDPNLTPRDIYNKARVLLIQSKDYDSAIEGFSKARDAAAGYDNELHYSASYNLAWTYAARAESKGDPNNLDFETLKSVEEDLSLSVAWFRDAVRQRPSLDECRENLEIVLKRMTFVHDIMLQKYYTIEKQLEDVLKAEQDIRNQTRELSESMQSAGYGVDPLLYRDGFKNISSVQRSALTDANQLAENVSDALAKIEAIPKEQRSQQDEMRAFQLKMAEPILEQARQSMAHARSQLRDLSMNDAWRLVNQSYNLLKQAREQFDQPLATLQHLIQDESDFIRLATSRFMLTSPDAIEAIKAKNPEADVVLPNWLNLPLLSDAQQDVNVRAVRLSAMLKAMSEGANNQLQNSQQNNPQQQKALQMQAAQIDSALPLINEAAEYMQAAIKSISNDDVRGAAEAGNKALKKLVLAAERFTDLKHLIEIAYGEQRQIASIVDGVMPNVSSGAEKHALTKQEQRTILAEELATNNDRLERLADLLAVAAAEANQPQQGQQELSEEQKQQIQQMFDQAEILRQNALNATASMREKIAALPEFVDEEAHLYAEALDELDEDNQVATKSLEQLRMLFFTIVEHVAELGRQQAETLDQMTEASAAALTPQPKPFEPILDRQNNHEVMADQLANALREQSEKIKESLSQATNAEEKQQIEEMSRRYEQAADELTTSAADMRQVQANIKSGENHRSEALEGQQSALEHIQNALQRLQPPQQQQNQDQQQQNQDQQQQNQDQQQKQEQQMSQEQAEKKIQQIRTREQDRRREREDKLGGAMAPVEKDW